MTGQERRNKVMNKWASDRFDELPENVRRCANVATHDLYYGPIDDCEEDGWIYPGFVEACRIISKEVGDIGEVWYDGDTGEVMDTEPDSQWFDEEDQQWYDNYMGEIYHYERQDVLRLIFDKELVSHID